MDNTAGTGASALSSPSNSRHIHKLTEDILWTIFSMNTTYPDHSDIFGQSQSALSEPMPMKGPLDTARFTSQVCSEWRHIILRSSSLWGRLLDFSALNQKSDMWREQVLRRSGISPLWVFADSLGDSLTMSSSALAQMSQFFLRLLNTHWERIERISVGVPNNLLATENWKAVQRPAPNLMSFKIYLVNASGYIDNSKRLAMLDLPGPLFSGNAPMLNAFDSQGTLCNLRLEGMSNLRHLALDHQWESNELISVLQNLPQLESLKLVGFKDLTTTHPHPVVNLPHLHNLTLIDCLYCVHYITPAPECAIQLVETREGHVDEYDDARYRRLKSCTGKIRRIFQDYLVQYPPKFLRLVCERDVFIIKKQHLPPIPLQEEYDACVDIYVSLHMQQGGAGDRDALRDLLLGVVTSPHLASVTELELKSDQLIGARIPIAFTKLAACFLSLTCLHISEHSLPFLLTSHAEEARLFPNLQTLKLLGIEPKGTYRAGNLERFLQTRTHRGSSPLKFLDITLLSGRLKRNLDSLEKFRGLIVIFLKDGEINRYECGSGCPEVLRFSHCKMEGIRYVFTDQLGGGVHLEIGMNTIRLCYD